MGKGKDIIIVIPILPDILPCQVVSVPISFMKIRIGRVDDGMISFAEAEQDARDIRDRDSTGACFLDNNPDW